MFNSLRNYFKCFGPKPKLDLIEPQMPSNQSVGIARVEEVEVEEEVMDQDEWQLCTKIEDHLYLGDFESATDFDNLKTLNIEYVLTVIVDELEPKYDSIKYMQIFADDFQLEDLLSHFADTNAFISKGQESGANVLVHCMMGRSRSATIVMAYLMAKYRMCYKSALNLVKSKRNISPNSGFTAQLELYEEMAFTLNANNRKLRKLLVQNVLHSETHIFAKWTNNMNEYFIRVGFIEQITTNLDLGHNYLCSKCDFKLFNEINVIKNIEIDGKPKASASCKWIYIEPQKWMNELFEFFDKMPSLGVNCPHCHQELVQFNRRFDNYIAECCQTHLGLKKSLRFRIEKSKFKIE